MIRPFSGVRQVERPTPVAIVLADDYFLLQFKILPVVGRFQIQRDPDGVFVRIHDHQLVLQREASLTIMGGRPPGAVGEVCVIVVEVERDLVIVRDPIFNLLAELQP